MIELPATLFDGKSSKAHEAKVQIYADFILVLFQGQQQFSRNQFRMMTPMKNCPLIIELEGGARLEFAAKDYDIYQVKELFKKKSDFLYWIENHKLVLSVSPVGIIAGVYLAIQIGISNFIMWLATKVPQGWANSADVYVLEQLDEFSFSHSTLPQDRQTKLREILKKHFGEDIQVKFRKIKFPNAFALPGHTIVIGDELVKLMERDEYVVAVAFHENAHLKNRHVLAQMISSAVLPAFAFLVVGDMVGLTESTLSLASVLVNSRYSRDFETQADREAAEQLEYAGLSRACFYEALQRFELVESSSAEKIPKFLNYLSTHPQLEERLKPIGGRPCLAQ